MAWLETKMRGGLLVAVLAAGAAVVACGGGDDGGGSSSGGASGSSGSGGGSCTTNADCATGQVCDFGTTSTMGSHPCFDICGGDPECIEQCQAGGGGSGGAGESCDDVCAGDQVCLQQCECVENCADAACAEACLSGGQGGSGGQGAGGSGGGTSGAGTCRTVGGQGGSGGGQGGAGGTGAGGSGAQGGTGGGQTECFDDGDCGQFQTCELEASGSFCQDIPGCLQSSTPGDVGKEECNTGFQPDDAKCQGNVCIAASANGFPTYYCSKECGCAADCPDGWTCSEVQSRGITKVCVDPKRGAK